jgi:hypothetical protein
VRRECCPSWAASKAAARIAVIRDEDDGLAQRLVTAIGKSLHAPEAGLVRQDLGAL